MWGDVTGTVAAAILLLGVGYWLGRWAWERWQDHRQWLAMPVLTEEECIDRCYRARPGRPMVELVERAPSGDGDRRVVVQLRPRHQAEG